MHAHTLLALDFDQTLAMTYPHIKPVWNGLLAQWLVQHGHKTNLTDAKNSLHSFDNPFNCGPTALAHQFGENKAWIEAFYLASAPHLIAACRNGGLAVPHDLATTLNALQSKGFYPMIISQGHRDSILPLLEMLGLNTVFSPVQVIDRAHKRLEPHGYKMAKYMARAYPITRFIMCDDSPANFHHAKAEGFETVLIEPNPTLEAIRSADTHTPDVLTFLKSL
jgi:FMN phosphatase YigB (HAD superfamily)